MGILRFESASHRKTMLRADPSLITIAQAYKYGVYGGISISRKR
jgi:hypothetical protein